MEPIVERWLPVVGWEGLYEVSDQGRVRSLDRITTSRFRSAQRRKGRILKEKINHNRSGYRQVALSNGDASYAYVHRLVLEAFAGSCPDGMECCHGDGDTSNNRLSNLRWDTRPENIADKMEHGTDLAGERNAAAKLTEDDIRSIRNTYKRTSYHDSNASELMKKYDITRGHLILIVKGRAWKHVI
jgi:cytochrome c553